MGRGTWWALRRPSPVSGRASTSPFPRSGSRNSPSAACHRPPSRFRRRSPTGSGKPGVWPMEGSPATWRLSPGAGGKVNRCPPAPPNFSESHCAARSGLPKQKRRCWKPYATMPTILPPGWNSRWCWTPWANGKRRTAPSLTPARGAPGCREFIFSRPDGSSPQACLRPPCRRQIRRCAAARETAPFGSCEDGSKSSSRCTMRQWPICAWRYAWAAPPAKQPAWYPPTSAFRWPAPRPPCDRWKP